MCLLQLSICSQKVATKYNDLDTNTNLNQLVLLFFILTRSTQRDIIGFQNNPLCFYNSSWCSTILL